MSERATFIARIESAITHAIDEMEKAEQQKPRDLYECSFLAGHVAGLKQALNLLKEPTS